MGFRKVASGGCDEKIKDFDMSWQVRRDGDRGGTHQHCSGKASRYDKPSLKIGELSKVCQPLAQGGDKSRQTTQSHWRVLQAYVLCSRTRRGDRSEE